MSATDAAAAKRKAEEEAIRVLEKRPRVERGCLVTTHFKYIADIIAILAMKSSEETLENEGVVLFEITRNGINLYYTSPMADLLVIGRLKADMFSEIDVTTPIELVFDVVNLKKSIKDISVKDVVTIRVVDDSSVRMIISQRSGSCSITSMDAGNETVEGYDCVVNGVESKNAFPVQLTNIPSDHMMTAAKMVVMKGVHTKLSYDAEGKIVLTSTDVSVEKSAYVYLDEDDQKRMQGVELRKVLSTAGLVTLCAGSKLSSQFVLMTDDNPRVPIVAQYNIKDESKVYIVLTTKVEEE